MSWPYPGDSPLVRARRVALAYRQRLQQISPQACAELDERMDQLGQGWAIPRPVIADPNAWISSRDAADLAAVAVATLYDLRKSGRLTGRRTKSGRWEYQVREIMALATQPRTRKKTGNTDG